MLWVHLNVKSASNYMTMILSLFLSVQVIGKVTLKKEDLRKYHARDNWFPLQVVDAHSEVQVSTSSHTHLLLKLLTLILLFTTFVVLACFIESEIGVKHQNF